MIWSHLSSTAAKRRFDELSANKIFVPLELSSEYKILREKILDATSPFNGAENQKSTYDVETGLILYRILSESGFEIRNAADDGIWRHLSLNVLPDRVECRWTHRPEERFWKNRSRIWLRAIWWLIHLAWQGSEKATRSALEGISTDMIVQIIERPGRQGFRIELARALFRERSKNQGTQGEFRSLMKLNTARVVVVEPEFYEGGIDGYASTLYASVKKNDRVAKKRR